jgi:hypothetical protein
LHEAWSGGIASAILIGAFAGLMPAIRASRMPPTLALRKHFAQRAGPAGTSRVPERWAATKNSVSTEDVFARSVMILPTDWFRDSSLQQLPWGSPNVGRSFRVTQLSVS